MFISPKKTLRWEKAFISCPISSQFLLSQVMENYHAARFLSLGMYSLFAKPTKSRIHFCMFIMKPFRKCYVELFLFACFLVFFVHSHFKVKQKWLHYCSSMQTHFSELKIVIIIIFWVGVQNNIKLSYQSSYMAPHRAFVQIKFCFIQGLNIILHVSNSPSLTSAPPTGISTPNLPHPPLPLTYLLTPPPPHYLSSTLNI